jgi:hypothetical protein
MPAKALNHTPLKYQSLFEYYGTFNLLDASIFITSLGSFTWLALYCFWAEAYAFPQRKIDMDFLG